MSVDFGGFQIRKAVLKDTFQIHALMQLSFESYVKLAKIETIDALVETAEDIENDILNPSKLVFVALMDDKIVGSARVEFSNETTAFFQRFGVDTKYQNIGIGKALLNVVDYTVKKHGIKKLFLYTGAKIAPLIRFYYGRGFYISSTDNSKGYLRALLCKEYD